MAPPTYEETFSDKEETLRANLADSPTINREDSTPASHTNEPSSHRPRSGSVTPMIMMCPPSNQPARAPGTSPAPRMQNGGHPESRTSTEPILSSRALQAPGMQMEVQLHASRPQRSPVHNSSSSGDAQRLGEPVSLRRTAFRIQRRSSTGTYPGNMSEVPQSRSHLPRFDRRVAEVGPATASLLENYPLNEERFYYNVRATAAINATAAAHLYLLPGNVPNMVLDGMLPTTHGSHNIRGSLYPHSSSPGQILASIPVVHISAASVAAEYTSDDNPGEHAATTSTTLNRRQKAMADDCLVCAEEGSWVGFETGCKHIACDECMVEWLKEHRKCPFCRRDVVHEEVKLIVVREKDTDEKDGPIS
ncbi:hypothetical protein TI39_contig426g00014 [Zymoseptoria brevis]|uniref:RING-type domain-containing protein n=1 Tax=Zymoseptoria brevis TaxID=1047168 RepID=A0A0F4GLW6_9PEZI|nr:hypothetical protein TI39_contig426g00014 [Zymoseptoria brevis]